MTKTANIKRSKKPERIGDAELESVTRGKGLVFPTLWFQRYYPHKKNVENKHCGNF